MSAKPKPIETAGEEGQKPDTGLRDLLGYRMKRCFNALRSDLLDTLEPFGLKMISFSVLNVICDSRALRQADISTILSIERPNLVAVLDEFERLELISRKVDPGDKRAFLISPTLKGLALRKAALIAVKVHEQRAMADLDETQIGDLMNFLDLVENRLAK